jgi:hypothetical protein
MGNEFLFGQPEHSRTSAQAFDDELNNAAPLEFAGFVALLEMTGRWFSL